jgi:hypothetical protein
MTAADLVDVLVPLLDDAPVTGSEPVTIDVAGQQHDIRSIGWEAGTLVITTGGVHEDERRAA